MDLRKKSRELEIIFKSVANHHRVNALLILAEEPELSLGELAEKLKVDYRSLSEHLRKLALGGLIMKRYEGNLVKHALTKRGKSILQFCRIVV